MVKVTQAIARERPHRPAPVPVVEDLAESALTQGVSGALDVNEVDLPAVVPEEVSQVLSYKEASIAP